MLSDMVVLYLVRVSGSVTLGSVCLWGTVRCPLANPHFHRLFFVLRRINMWNSFPTEHTIDHDRGHFKLKLKQLFNEESGM